MKVLSGDFNRRHP